MSLTLEQIVDETRQWPRDRVAQLVDCLSAEMQGGVAEDIDLAWKVETRRRVAEIESGQAEFIPGEEVMADLRRIAGR